MCGVAGYSGITIKDRYRRMALVDSLGVGIQARGRDAWGWVGGDNGGVQTGKGLGRWSAVTVGTTFKVSEYDSVIMHARYATHGAKDDVRNAHPFCIRRGNRTALYGVHNGVLQGTEKSADRHGRNHTVDSRELFELLADERYADIAGLSGYGLLAWMTPRSRVVKLCKLTPGANIAVARVNGGGIVFASESSMVLEAMRVAGLTLDKFLTLDRVGATYMLWNGILSENKAAEPILLSGDKAGVREGYSYGRRGYTVGPSFDWAERLKKAQEELKARSDETASDVDAMFRSTYVRDENGSWWQQYADGYACKLAQTPTWSPEYKAWERKAMAERTASVADAAADTVREPPSARECDHGVSSDADCYQCEAEAFVSLGETTVNEGQATG